MEICIDKRQAVLQIKLGHRKAVEFMGNKNLIITIEREYGSGGRIVGRKLAEELGLHFYDDEILKMASEKSAVERNFSV